MNALCNTVLYSVEKKDTVQKVLSYSSFLYILQGKWELHVLFPVKTIKIMIILSRCAFTALLGGSKSDFSVVIIPSPAGTHP